MVDRISRPRMPSFGKNAKAFPRHHTDTSRVLELGPREAELLAALWRYGESTVNELYEAAFLEAVSVNTVHSTLERLYRKGFVERTRQRGRSYIYRPALQQPQLISLCIRAIADRLAQGSKDQMIDGIADYLSDQRPD